MACAAYRSCHTVCLLLILLSHEIVTPPVLQLRKMILPFPDPPILRALASVPPSFQAPVSQFFSNHYYYPIFLDAYLKEN